MQFFIFLKWPFATKENHPKKAMGLLPRNVHIHRTHMKSTDPTWAEQILLKKKKK